MQYCIVHCTVLGTGTQESTYPKFCPPPTPLLVLSLAKYSTYLTSTVPYYEYSITTSTSTRDVSYIILVLLYISNINIKLPKDTSMAYVIL